jgi:hypothetical protein
MKLLSLFKSYRFIYGDTNETSRKTLQLVLVGGNHFVINPTYHELNDNAFNIYVVPIINKSRTIESICNQIN